MRISTLALVAIMAPAAAHAGDDAIVGARVPADVIAAYDGDTLTVDAHPWPDIVIRTHVRLRGVDTPEIKGHCDREREKALAARSFVLHLVADSTVLLEDVEPDKYGGRVDATVLLADGRNLADVLIAAGLGRPYSGGTRQGWCD